MKLAEDQRYYAGRYGRMNTPDPLLHANLLDSQTFNQYAYAGDDPVNNNDPTGLCSVFIAGFTSKYDGNSDFTKAATAAGSEQAYPYSGQNLASSFISWVADAGTIVAPGAITDALQRNSGQVDVVAWSGGAGAFTSAYNLLSPDQQKRIGNIVYVGPAGKGTLTDNGASTSYLLGSDWKDGVDDPPINRYYLQP